MKLVLMDHYQIWQVAQLRFLFDYPVVYNLRLAAKISGSST